MKLTKFLEENSYKVSASGKNYMAVGFKIDYVYVDQESFEQHKPATFAGLVNAFREYQDQKQEA